MAANTPVVTTLRTERLTLRPVTIEDTDVIAAMQMDPQVMRHYGNGQPLDEMSARETVTKYHVWCQDHGYWAWAVTRRDTGEVLGQVTAGPSALGGDGSIELGFILKAAAWGVGFGPEAVRAVIEHGQTALHWPTIVAGVTSQNLQSIRLCEKVGMTHLRDEPGRQGVRHVYLASQSS